MKEHINITYREMEVPAGTVVTAIRVGLAEAGGFTASQDVPPGTAEVEFVDVKPGTYAAVAFAVDADGTPIPGSQARTSFMVPAPPPPMIKVSVPDTISARGE